MAATTGVPSLPRRRRRAAATAAIASLLMMPLTAMWFLLIGGLLLVAGLLGAIARDDVELGAVGSVGLGLLAGPAVYIGLALVQ